jgi:hypothetical protein
MAEAKLWFKAKRYGWGWYPSSLEGLVVILGYVAIFFVAEWIFMQRVEGGTLSAGDIVLYGLFVTLLTIVLIRICYIKGEKPRWRWGNHDRDKGK